MPETSADTALQQALALHSALIASPFTMKNGLNLEVSASVGLATAPDDGISLHSVIGMADTRMYAVKSDGRGQVKGA